VLLAGCGQPVAAGSSDLDARIVRVENGLLLSSSLADRMAHHHVPGLSIAVVNDFALEWTKGYGVMQLGQADPVTPDALFQAASISKPVTAVAALRYVERGLLDLDENVNHRLISWQVPQNEFTAQADVTLRRLLSHTAGINQGLNRGYAPGEGVPTMLQALDGLPPANSLPVRVDRVPGTQNYYSNGGYLLVAQLLQDAVGKPYTELMNDSIFEPIGMTSSTFEQTLPVALSAHAATPHGWDVVSWRPSPGLVGEAHIQDPGYSGLWTTAPDLARFAIEVMLAYTGESDAVLSEDMTKLMLTPVTEGIPLQEPFDADQALGFSLIELGGETWFIHFGGCAPGYISVLLSQPERGFGVAILTNAWSGYELIWEILYSIFYAYGILPNTGQVLNISYSLVLFVAAILVLPVRHLIRRKRLPREGGEDAGYKRGRLATLAILVVLFTVAAVLVLSVLYRGPLGGYLIPDRGSGEPPLNKALLGIFFSLPFFLVGLTAQIWLRRYWSASERVIFTLLVLAALVGVFLLRDLWPLMFWG